MLVEGIREAGWWPASWVLWGYLPDKQVVDVGRRDVGLRRRRKVEEGLSGWSRSFYQMASSSGFHFWTKITSFSPNFSYIRYIEKKFP